MKTPTKVLLAILYGVFVTVIALNHGTSKAYASENSMPIDQIIKWHSDCASLAKMSGYDNKAAIHLKALEPYMDNHAMIINAHSSYAQGMIEGVALSVAGDKSHKEKIVVVAQSIYKAGCPTS